MMRYISIKQVLDNLLDNPLMRDLSLERAVNYAVRFIQVIGMPNIFLEKTKVVDINNYRGELPCDLYEIIQVRKTYSDGKVGNTESFVYSTDSFHMSKDKTADLHLTYKIQGSCIFTSIKEGQIEIAYRAINIDNDGFPLIPENGTFENALELYIKKHHYTTLFELGKINQQVLQHTEQQYAWAVGQAEADLVRPTIDQLQAFTSSWNTLVQRTTEHNSGFKYNSMQERIKLQ